MKLDDIRMIDIVPKFMSDDKTVRGLCAAADVILKAVIDKIGMVNLYENLELLTDEDLNFIAKEDKVLWYDTSYTKDQKIRIIQNYEKNSMILGTPAAIENVISEIFGDGYVREWFEYGSTPYHFKIITNKIITENINELVGKIIDQAKNVRSELEVVEIKRQIIADAKANMIGVAVYKTEAIKDEYEIGG